MSTYDNLHRQCRTLENQFDVKLSSYSQLASTISRSKPDLEATGSLERWKDLDRELEEMLVKLEEANEQLSRLASNPELLSPAMLRTIQRHKEVCQDNARDLRRTKATAQQALDQAILFSGIRNDIDAHKSSTTDALLAERGRIDSSHSMTDDLLQQAYETRSEFSRQRSTLASVNSRMGHIIKTMPGVNNLVSMIRNRRRRDSIIMGLVIGVCIIILLSYLWR
ncbi:hypothetical protein APHAL10511_005886 [Amanita phalloides]|nr:hypothetical protein APHAL10511_005886 [Amanita phalloides]